MKPCQKKKKVKTIELEGGDTAQPWSTSQGARSPALHGGGTHFLFCTWKYRRIRNLSLSPAKSKLETSQVYMRSCLRKKAEDSEERCKRFLLASNFKGKDCSYHKLYVYQLKQKLKGK